MCSSPNHLGELLNVNVGLAILGSVHLEVVVFEVIIEGLGGKVGSLQLGFLILIGEEIGEAAFSILISGSSKFGILLNIKLFGVLLGSHGKLF
jgi:hypothetical protein